MPKVHRVRDRMDDARFWKLMNKARHTNADRDAHEREVGFQAASDGSIWQQVRTVMCALQAGIQMHDEDCLAEAMAMLEVIERGIRPGDYGSHSQYPNLPVHSNVLHEPGGRQVIIAETYPIEKLSHRQACKYCHQEHENWWLMDQRDYDVDGLTIILCGECEHTSAKEEA